MIALLQAVQFSVDSCQRVNTRPFRAALLTMVLNTQPSRDV